MSAFAETRTAATFAVNATLEEVRNPTARNGEVREILGVWRGGWERRVISGGFWEKLQSCETVQARNGDLELA